MILSLFSLLSGSVFGRLMFHAFSTPSEQGIETEEANRQVIAPVVIEDTFRTDEVDAEHEKHQSDVLDASDTADGHHQATSTAAPNPSDQIAGDDTAPDQSGHMDMGNDTPHDHSGHMDTGNDTPPDHSDHMDTGNDTPHDHSGYMDTGDDTHDTHDHGSLTTSGLPQTSEEIAAFVAEIIATPDVHVHGAESPLMGEHRAMLNLVDKAEATHIAIASGSWFDPKNWHNGEVPGDDAKVLVSNGIALEYDAQSNARLFTVRVDGELHFATDQDSKMVVDTFVVAPHGTLTIGTAENPVEDDVTAEIVIANNGAIDVNWDPSLLSRGLISHGEVSIHGQIKDSHEKVIEDPMAGDTSITFDELPVGWEVGDKIVIAGTDHEGHYYDTDLKKFRFHESEDEVRIITDIQGDTVFFDTALEYDHDTPRDDLFTSVANYSRNVKIGTEDPASAEVYERGHVMFMHSNNVDVRYAEFNELGRTDKSEASLDADEVDTIAFDTNVKGRYGLHLHRLGTDNQDDPAIIVGNSVFGSPGWGFAHHDSNAILDNNASFNTFGAGFVSESGNETGVWSDNIAILSVGNSNSDPKIQADSINFDTARSGDGFWAQSRMLEIVDNVAASVNHGFVYYHRGGFADDAQLLFDSEILAFPEAVYFTEKMLPTHTPILMFQNNESFASKQGLHIVKSNPNQGHDIHSKLDGFTAWNVISGAHLEYTSHYTLNDFDLIAAEADRDEVRHVTSNGIEFFNNVSDIAIIDAKISGFETGIDLFKRFLDENASVDQHQYNVIDTVFEGTVSPFANYDPSLDTIASSTSFFETTPRLELDGPLLYSNAASRLSITGTKTDSLGKIDFPSGTDRIELSFLDMARVLQENGYYTTDTGEKAVVFSLYFSDRLTGDIYKQPTLINLDDDVIVGTPFGRYKDATHNGEVTYAELQAMGNAGPSKVELEFLNETIQSENLYGLAVHDSWDAYNALTKDQAILTEEGVSIDPPSETVEYIDLL